MAENKPKSPKLITLRKKSEFNQIFHSGARYRSSSWMLVNYIKNDLSYCRWGFTIPKFIGNATLRNKFRRWSKEIIRKNSDVLTTQLDVNIVFMKKKEEFYKDVSFSEFEKTFQKSFSKLFS